MVIVPRIGIWTPDHWMRPRMGDASPETAGKRVAAAELRVYSKYGEPVSAGPATTDSDGIARVCVCRYSERGNNGGIVCYAPFRAEARQGDRDGTVAGGGQDWRRPEQRFGFTGLRGNTPGEIAAYLAAVAAAEEDPAQPFNDIPLPDLYLPDAADIPTTAEIEAAIAGGMTILATNDRGTRARLVRYVTSKTEHEGVPFEALLDLTIPRSMAYAARQVDTRLGLKFRNVKRSERNRQAIRAEVLDVLYKLEEAEVLQNVEAHKDELAVEPDADVPTRLNVAIPTSVIPPLAQIAGELALLVE